MYNAFLNAVVTCIKPALHLPRFQKCLAFVATFEVDQC